MKNIGKGFENCIGIYCIKCLGNNQIYIGSSKNIKERWEKHISYLRARTHHSPYLQKSYNKYGEDSLEFSVLLHMFDYNEELLRLNELYYIEMYKPKFNVASPVIYECTDIWKKKISESTKKLYENGYINPRKDVGRKYNAVSIITKEKFYNLPILELCDITGTKRTNYRNLNNKLRKDGIYYMRVRKFLTYRIDVSIDLVKSKYPKYADYAVSLSN